MVLIISDGWDRGEPELLRRETARLQRSCHRLVWLNPLLGSPDYEPLTRGMQAAPPFVDDLLPAHNLASLEELARHLSTLSPQRGARRQQTDVAMSMATVEDASAPKPRTALGPSRRESHLSPPTVGARRVIKTPGSARWEASSTWSTRRT